MGGGKSPNGVMDGRYPGGNPSLGAPKGPCGCGGGGGGCGGLDPAVLLRTGVMFPAVCG